ncbi:MAG: hypothetical protein WA682_08330, partial [Acidobacteriaceae bacterium]
MSILVTAAALTIGMGGCGGSKKPVVAMSSPGATAPTLAAAPGEACPAAKQAFPQNPTPRLVEYFFLDKGKHYAD